MNISSTADEKTVSSWVKGQVTYFWKPPRQTSTSVMPFSETELVVQMGALDSDSSCHRKIFALLPKTVLVLTYKLINYGGVEAWGRGQLKSQAQSMCFVAWTDGLLSLTSPLQQEHPSRATGLSVPWLADRVSPSSISSRE